MKFHLCAIGGAVMHNLALALQDMGHRVSGSDDQIYEPSLGRLKAAGLLPESMGWHPQNIDSDIDAFILGMHAKKDNPELLKAQSLGIPVKSFPEFVYEQSISKNRIVIAGSHGKTSLTSIILHCFKFHNKACDYLVGAQLEGFKNMVKLSDADTIILEGDEYLSSAIDSRPKFLHYRPNIALITGIAWDHVNVFPTFKSYLQPFKDLITGMSGDEVLLCFEEDVHLKTLVHNIPPSLATYKTPEYEMGVENRFKMEGQWIKTHLFGKHNFQNLNGAWQVLKRCGFSLDEFSQALLNYKGAAKRMDVLVESQKGLLIRDFAHSPSKVKATVNACRERFPEHVLISVFELHTFSSLTKEFLPQYKGSLDPADKAVIFYSEETLKNKKMKSFAKSDVQKAFGRPDLEVFTEVENLKKFLRQIKEDKMIFLMMSSGHFRNLNMLDLGNFVLQP